jgi:hypothetical protein
MIGEPTIADAILDRIVHNAHRIAVAAEVVAVVGVAAHRWTIRAGHQDTSIGPW